MRRDCNGVAKHIKTTRTKEYVHLHMRCQKCGLRWHKLVSPGDSKRFLDSPPQTKVEQPKQPQLRLAS